MTNIPNHNMKNLVFFLSLAVLAACFFSCKKAADKFVPPNLENPLTAAVPVTKTTVDGVLIHAYTFLDGVYPTQPGATWETGTDNWIYGSVAGGEAHKGSVISDQPAAGEIETFTESSSNVYFND